MDYSYCAMFRILTWYGNTVGFNSLARNPFHGTDEGTSMTQKRRIGIVGVGHVGAHVANALLMQGLADELYLCDIAEKRLASEVQDLLDAMSLYPTNCSIINCGVAYERLAACDIIVNAAGDITASLTNRDLFMARTKEPL